MKSFQGLFSAERCVFTAMPFRLVLKRGILRIGSKVTIGQMRFHLYQPTNEMATKIPRLFVILIGKNNTGCITRQTSITPIFAFAQATHAEIKTNISKLQES